MADDRAREVTARALNHLEVELAAGRSDGLKSLFDTMGKFPNYSWSNDLLISQQRPMATVVASMHKWEKLGRSVREGEKPITILAPVFKRDGVLGQTLPNPGQSVATKGDVSRLVGFRPSYVYDVEQTQGKPLPEVPKFTPQDYGDKLRTFVTKQGISLEYDKSISPTQGVSFDGRIRLAPDMKPAEEFSVLARELAHEMLHHGKGKARLPETVVETQAEAVAYVVCRGAGLDTNSAAARYSALYNGDKKTLAESLSVIQETSSKILDQLLPEQHRSPFQEKPGRSLSDMAGHVQGETDRAHQASLTPPAQAPDQSDSISLDR
jgi:hypothetical protein